MPCGTTLKKYGTLSTLIQLMKRREFDAQNVGECTILHLEIQKFSGVTPQNLLDGAALRARRATLPPHAALYEKPGLEAQIKLCRSGLPIY